jgi:cell division protein FtsQ
MVGDLKNLGRSEFGGKRTKREEKGRGDSGRNGGGSLFIASFFKLFIIVLIICGVVSFLFVGMPRMKVGLDESEYFRLENVDIVGVERAGKAEIIRAVGVKAGGSILKTDLAAIRSRVKDVSWVKEVEVMRELPARLIIKVQEHDPVGVIAPMGDIDIGDGFLFVDVDGETALINEEISGYPVFTGFEETEELIYGAELITKLIDEGIVGKNSIKGIKYDEVMGFRVMTKGGVLLRFGHPPFAEKIKRLIVVMTDSMDRGEIEYIYLDIENSIVVKYRGI